MNTLSDIRKALKPLGFKIKTQSFSFGKSATYQKLNGKSMPSIFFDEESRQDWIDLINFRDTHKDILKEIGKSEGISGL